MIAKVGILDSIFQILSLVSRGASEFGSNEKVLQALEISDLDFEGFKNLLEILIKSVHVAIQHNPMNLVQSIKNMDILQTFIFVKGCSILLIDMFKDKNFEFNKKEIHSEILHRRIFEIERFENVIDYFVNKLKTEQNYIYLVILRKMCIIDCNSFPLVQDKILDDLYRDNQQFLKRIEILAEGDQLQILLVNDDGKRNEVPISEFFASAAPQQKNFLLEQLTLEADLCYGRNETSKDFFREIYSCQLLIRNIQDNSADSELRGKFIRLLTYIYIDDPPHKLLNLPRAFKAYESSNEYVKSISSTRSKFLDDFHLDSLVHFIHQYIEGFCK